jgi:hypothetical protein
MIGNANLNIAIKSVAIKICPLFTFIPIYIERVETNKNLVIVKGAYSFSKAKLNVKNFPFKGGIG